MQSKKKLVLSLALFLVCGVIFLQAQTRAASGGASVSELQAALGNLPLSPSEWAELSESGILSRFHQGPSTLSLNPLTRANSAIAPRLDRSDASLGIEVLAAIRLPSRIAQSPNPDLTLYNILHRFRTMEGLEYWSASRNEMRVFYDRSHLVNPDRHSQALPDPVFQAIPETQVLMLRQRDLSFGDNRYEVLVRSYPARPLASGILGLPGLHLSMENLTTLWYAIVPIAGPGKVQIDLTVTRTEDYVFFYGTTSLGVPGLPGLRDKARESFYNRIVALVGWFSGELQRP